MNKSNNSSLFKTSLMVAMLAGAFSAQAAGLGKLTVYSAIGQPLNAELALTAAPEEISSISAKLASHNAFRDAGIELMPALTSLRFSVVKSSAGQPVLRLHTDNPLNEPFLHFLIELNWSTGRVVREYTFLLDPPEMVQASKPASVVAPAVPAASSAPQMTPLPSLAPKAKEPASVSAPAAVSAKSAAKPAPVASQGVDAQEYRVKAGDTLGKIARGHKPDSVSLDQMLVALFNSNRDAFDGGNMSRLRAGKILRVPDPAEAATVDASEARKLVVAQALDFNAYRRRLAEAAGNAPAAEMPPQQQASGKIKPQVEAKAPAAPVQDKLEVSRTEAGKSGKQAKAALEEELIARDKALREASERIAQLEKSLENLKQLVEIKSQSGAQMQQQAKPAPAPTTAAETKVAPAAPVATAPVVEKAPEKPVEATAVVAKPVEPQATTEKQVEQPTPATQEKPPAVPAPVVKKPVASPPPPLPEPSFVEESPEVVFGGAGLLALLLGYFGFNAWRRKKQAVMEAAGDQMPAFAAADLADSSVGTPVADAALPSADNGEVSILGDFSESGALTTEENVDPVAEADVLMAYGRDAQAEEILLEGLKADPTRAAIHLKLLELYAHRQDAVQFEAMAAELFTLTNGHGSEWEKASAMALELGATHGVFASAADAGRVPVASADEEPAVKHEEAADRDVNSTAILEASPLAVSEPAAAEGGNGLDFDLDLGTTSAPAAARAETVSAQQAPGEEVMSLDFDFDLGSDESAATQAKPAPEDVVVETAPVEDAGGNAVDFSLDIGSAPAASEPVATEESEVAVPAGNEIAFDLDLGSEEGAAVAVTDVAEEEVPAAGDLGEVKLDFDVQLDGAIPAAAPEAAEDVPAALDLADISLDLDQPEAAVPGQEMELPAVSDESEPPLAALDLPAVESPAAAVETDFDLDLGMDLTEVAPPVVAEVPAEPAPVARPVVAAIELPDIDLSLDSADLPAAEPPASEMTGEMDFDLGSEEASAAVAEATGDLDDPEVATKLELAQAYEEMGDREGARELLNEVLNEGSAAQRAVAQARLDQLAV